MKRLPYPCLPFQLPCSMEWNLRLLHFLVLSDDEAKNGRLLRRERLHTGGSPLPPERQSQGAYTMCGCLWKAQREASHLGRSHIGTPFKSIR